MIKSINKLVNALLEYGKETEKSIITPNVENNEDFINFIVIDEEFDTIYIGTKQDYLTLDNGTLELDTDK